MYSSIKKQNRPIPKLTQKNQDGIHLHESAVFRQDLPFAWFAGNQDKILALGLGDGSQRPESKAGVLASSSDGGQTWQIISDCEPAGMRILPGPFLLTKKGTCLVVFSNLAEKSDFAWDEEKHDMPGAVLPTYVIRSTDTGQSWSKPLKLHDEWTGANRAIVETRQGSIVFSSMKLLHDPGRHAVLTYRSIDQGATWQASNLLDLGGVGHHGGATESALLELTDGRLVQYIRTNWGQFWQAFSHDDGYSFHLHGPTGIDASSAPAFLLRLQSGRMLLFWNRWYPYGQSRVDLRGGDGQWSATPVSNFRAELSFSFSDDNGVSWADPFLLANNPGGQLAYPVAFEAAPGQIWVTVHWTRYAGQSKCPDQAILRFMFKEADFLE